MCAAVGPVIDDIAVIGNVDMVQIDAAEFLHPGDQKIGVAFPARAAGIGGAAFGLEGVPGLGLIGRNQQAGIDLEGGRPTIRLGADARDAKGRNRSRTL